VNERSYAQTLRRGNRLELVLGEAQNILEDIPQIILLGPPGTGKTYAAIHTSRQSCRKTGKREYSR